ncbi:MAG: hypothetical protein NVS2B3_12140 [Vulcanimicrobiaceae bacterium]
MKLERPQRLVLSLALCGATAVVAFGPSAATGARAQPATPPPPPAPNSTTRLATPTANASPVPASAALPTASHAAAPAPKGRKRGRAASPSESASPGATANPEPSATPTSPAFASLDGTWEFQLQYIDRTEYSYLTIAQGTAGAISGSWKLTGSTVYPFQGTYDGRAIRMVAKGPKGDITLTGYVEGASDMVGLVNFGTTMPGAKPSDGTAFTAEHRPSPKGSVFKKGT